MPTSDPHTSPERQPGLSLDELADVVTDEFLCREAVVAGGIWHLCTERQMPGYPG